MLQWYPRLAAVLAVLALVAAALAYVGGPTNFNWE